MDEKELYFFRNDDYFVPLPGVKEGVFVISLKLVPAIGDVHERGQGRGSRSTMIIGKRHRGRVKWSFRLEREQCVICHVFLLWFIVWSSWERMRRAETEGGV